MSKPSLAVVVTAFAALTFACGSSSVGFECTQNTDCDSAQTCFTSQPGGFCSKSCSQEGTVTECPGGSVCARQGTALLCSPICKDQGACRDAYECNGVTGSDDKACRAK